MKHEFFKDNGVEMVRITIDPTNVVVRPATKEDHENAKHDDPDPVKEPKEKEPLHAKKSPGRHDED